MIRNVPFPGHHRSAVYSVTQAMSCYIALQCTYGHACLSEFCVEAQQELFEPLLVCLQDVQLRTLLH